MAEMHFVRLIRIKNGLCFLHLIRSNLSDENNQQDYLDRSPLFERALPST